MIFTSDSNSAILAVRRKIHYFIAMAVNISLATEADLKGLISVFIKAQDTDLLHRLKFKRGQTDNDETETGLAHLDLLDQIKDSKSRVFKATLKSDGRVVGFGSTQFQYGEIAEYLEPDYTPDDFNGALASICGRECVELHRKHLNGQKHVGQCTPSRSSSQDEVDDFSVWQTLYVLPAFQDQGIASELLTWGFDHFGLAQETIWVQTSISRRSIFLGFGWEDIDHVDVDLTRWAEENMGYGCYRLQMMIRRLKQLERATKM